MDFIHPVFLISLRANGQRREKRRDFNKTQVAEDNLSERIIGPGEFMQEGIQLPW